MKGTGGAASSCVGSPTGDASSCSLTRGSESMFTTSSMVSGAESESSSECSLPEAPTPYISRR
eukprot:3480486-Rhodomonas_salina.1